MEQTKQRQEGGGGTWCCSDWLCPLQTCTHTHTLRHTHTYNLCIHLPLHAHMLVHEGGGQRGGRECVASEPSPLLSGDGLLPVQQIGLIAKKNLPTCVEKKKRKEHDQNTPADQYSLQRWRLVILSDMREKGQGREDLE